MDQMSLISPSPSELTVNEMAVLVGQSPDYRVLRRLQVPDAYAPPDDLPKRLALLVDVETTSLDTSQAMIIEIGAVLFEYAPSTGRVYRILETYGSLNDPGVPIPESITHITGITDDMVRGQHYDQERVEQLVRQANIVIAHHAGYDRKVTERFFPSFAGKPWACSLLQIPWVELGLGSTKLDYILYSLGLFNDGHRAVNDCLSTIHILAQEWNGSQLLVVLLGKAREVSAKFWAIGAPFEAKDLLKDREYRWSPGDDGRPKAWWKSVPDTERHEELAWLSENVYNGNTESVVIEQVDALNRFSVRE